MVVSPEIVRAKEQLQSQAGEIERRAREFEEARREIEARQLVSVPERTKQELLRMTRQQQAQFKASIESAKKEEAKIKEQVLKEISEQEKQFSKQAGIAKSQISSEIKRLGEIGEEIKAAQRSEYGLGKSISAYYQPSTGEVIYQSISPEIAAKGGLVPISVYSETLQPVSDISVSTLPEFLRPAPSPFYQPTTTATGKPFLTVTPVGTPEQIRQQQIERAQVESAGPFTQLWGAMKEGVFRKASPKFGEKTAAIGYKISPTYQPEATAKLFGAVGRVIPYFHPAVGPALLVGAGTEHVATPAGREEIRMIGAAVEEKYGVPRQAAWLIPPAEIGLGTYPLWYPKVKGYVQTIGRKELEFPSYGGTFPEAGKGLAPYERAKLHKQLFLKPGPIQQYGYQAGGYHAYPEPISNLIVSKPLHISTQPSYYFMRVPSGKGASEKVVNWLYSDILTPVGAKPGVMYVVPKEGKGGFKALVGTETKRGVYNWLGPTETGYAYVPGTKAEIQAVFIKSTPLKPTGGKFFFRYEGIRYPIDTFQALGTRKVVSATKTYGELLPLYSGTYTPKVPSSSFLGGISSSSLAVSKSISGYAPVSKIKSVYPISSIISTRYPSKISYKPTSYVSSYEPKVSRYKPSISYKLSVSKPKPSRAPKPPVPRKQYLPLPTKIREPPIVKMRRKPELKFSKAYQTWIKRAGRWRALSGVYAKGEAIRRGERESIRTLAATFKITPTEKLIKAPPVEYKPSPRMFRGYRIVKGKIVPLKEEWIQKARFRLGTIGEVKEIQLAKKKSKGRSKSMRWL